LLATGTIHLDLYLTGYRTIPTIGWLFLLQVIGDVTVAVAVAVSSSRLISAAAAGLVLSTLVGYLLALRINLFGFREVRTSAGIVAGVIEIVGFATFAWLALRPPLRDPNSLSPSSGRRQFLAQKVALRAGRWIAGVLTVQAAITLGLLLPNADAASSVAGGSTTTLKAADIHGVSVLTNARGYTLYWFAPDSSTTSRCYGTCAAYWPPVVGSPSAMPDVAGSFSTLTRTGGKRQVTYNGHPLYTYVGDSAPGQATGNHINLNGGEWYEMKVSG
jgi:predicted lipoprotein with Yx(FWY)xxD motif